MLVYLFDLKYQTKKQFNRIKRKFYYRLGLLNLKKECFFTKSGLVIDERDEAKTDNFFRQFKKIGKDIIIYKFFTTSMEEFQGLEQWKCGVCGPTLQKCSYVDLAKENWIFKTVSFRYFFSQFAKHTTLLAGAEQIGRVGLLKIHQSRIF